MHFCIYIFRLLITAIALPAIMTFPASAKDILDSDSKDALSPFLRGIEIKPSEKTEKLLYSLSETISERGCGSELIACRKVIALALLLKKERNLVHGLREMGVSLKEANDFPNAYRILEIAYHIARKNPKQTKEEVLEIEILLAQIASNCEKKIKWITKARKDAKSVGKLPDHLVLFNYAHALLRSHKNLARQADRLVEISKPLLDRAYNEDSKGLEAYLKIETAKLLYNSGKFSECVETIDRKHVVPQSWASHEFLIENSHLKAKCLFALEKKKDALKILQNARAIHDTQANERYKKRGLFDDAWEDHRDLKLFYDELIKQELALGNKEQTITWVENNKAAALYNHSLKNEIKTRYSKTAEVNRRQDKEFMEFLSTLPADPDPDEKQKIIQSLRELKVRHEQEKFQLNVSLAMANNGMNSTFGTGAFMIAKLKASIKPDAAGISYHFGSEQAIGFLVTKGNLQAIELPHPTELYKLKADQFSAAILNPHQHYYEDSAKWLYNNLVFPVLKLAPPGIKTIAISSDPMMGGLPFAALMSSEGFLGRHYNIALAPNLWAAGKLLSGEIPLPKNGISCVNPDVQNSSLPFQETTGEVLHSLSPNSSTLLKKQDCNLKKLRAAVDASKEPIFLHIGAHGRFVKESPMDSSILLAVDETELPKPTGSGRNPASSSAAELWTAEEMVAEKFENVALVTLSSCETGVMGSNGSRATTGIIPSLLLAGVKGVVAPIWSVQDESSSKFMQAFHKAAHSGQTAAEALSSAQREMMSSELYKHPFYWAGYTYTESSP